MNPGTRLRSRSLWAAALLAALFSAGLLAYWKRPGKKPELSAPSSAAQRIDLTFLVASDTHLGLDAPEDPSRNPLTHPSPIESRNKAMIERMNGLAGTPFPAELGGKVGLPSAVLVAGDLTESGGESQWRLFTRFYGWKGGDGLLRFPVFETFGNHDYANDDSILDRIRERHGGTHYSFDVGGIHFVGLGEAPEEQGLAFLNQDLDARPADTPTVIFFHLPLRGPWAENNWFAGGGFRERLKTILQGHRILAIFHGHSHFSSAYRWNGIEVYNPGSVKHSQRAFLVVRICDDSMTVAAWNLDFEDWWWWHRKPLDSTGTGKAGKAGGWAPPGFRIQPWLELPQAGR